ncbi:MAG: TerC family protein [Actinomycetota bacterium]
MDVSPIIWVAFVGFVLLMLTMDLFVFHRDAHAVSAREAAIWTAIWMSMGIGFTFVIWFWQGGTFAGEYIAGYLLEYSLSADNIFVFVLIFSYFTVPADVQHRVLFWGILGALVFRAAFILAGAALLDRFHFMFYVFGAFLIFTGVRMATHGEVEVHPERNFVLRLARRLYPMTAGYRGQSFFVNEAVGTGKDPSRIRRMATPLLAVLIVVETTDIIFAVDSIPAIFGVTDEPFLVFTSNAFAIMGLRALYFLLANMMSRFEYLQVGLAAILVFIGIKMVLEALPHDFVLHLEVPIWASLGFIVLSLTTAVVFSLRRETKAEPPAPAGHPEDDASG